MTDDRGLAVERTSLAWSRAALSLVTAGAFIGRGIGGAGGVVLGGTLLVLGCVAWRQQGGRPMRPGVARALAWGTAAVAVVAAGLAL